MSERGSRPRAFAWVILSYVVALALAGVVARWGAPWVPGGSFGLVLAADVVATCVVFAFSVAFDNSSFYDAYWSVAPIAIAPWLLTLGPGANRERQVLVVGLIVAWGVRLTWNWARGWTGLGHEDWRYRDIRDKTKKAYWPASFLGIHLFPTVLVYLGCLPLWTSLVDSPAPLGPLDALAAIVTAGAIVIEATADNQLRRFVLSRPAAGTLMSEGLWRYSRHPNYFGELSFWWGLSLFGFAAGGMPWWGFSGALAMTGLFVFVSGPLLDRRSTARRPGYAEHMKRTSMLIPLPPKR